MPIGAEKIGILAAAGAAGGNYFGDGSDGALTTSGNVVFTPENISGSDADMIVKNYTTLDVTSSYSLSSDSKCRGMFIYVKGNCTIAGSISMSTKASTASPLVSGGSDSAVVDANGIQLPMFTASGTDTLAAPTFAGCGNSAVAATANQPAIEGDGTTFSIIRDMNNGGAAVVSRSGGSTGGAGTTGAKAIGSGGGASGGAHSDHPANGCSAGRGGHGGCFGGGGGSGGASGQNGRHSGAGGDFGGPGSGGVCGGSGWGGCQAGPGAGDCGGLVWLVVGGDLTFTGSISATGTAGTPAVTVGNGGGGSGGGAIMILYAGSLSDSGSRSLGGGGGGTGLHTAPGGLGGTGGQHIEQVSE